MYNAEFENFFDLFNLPLSFLISQECLDAQYFQMQKKYHPDFYTSGVLQNEVQKISIKINTGYDILKDPLKRAQHILEILSWWPVEDDRDLLQEVFLWYQNGLSFQDWTLFYRESEHQFESGIQRKDKSETQKAYLRMVYLKKVKS